MKRRAEIAIRRMTTKIKNRFHYLALHVMNTYPEISSMRHNSRNKKVLMSEVLSGDHIRIWMRAMVRRRGVDQGNMRNEEEEGAGVG